MKIICKDVIGYVWMWYNKHNIKHMIRQQVNQDYESVLNKVIYNHACNESYEKARRRLLKEGCVVEIRKVKK